MTTLKALSLRLPATTLAIMTLAAPAFASVTVNSPANGAAVGSPVQYLASASTTCAKGVASMGVYVDNQLKFVEQGAHLSAPIALAAGTYNTFVQEWDHCGGASGTPIRITVGAATGVSVAEPANGSTVASPVAFAATASTTTCAKGIASMGVYVDNRLLYVQQGASLDTSVNLASGVQHAVVQEWDRCGGASVKAVNLIVSGSTQAGIPPSRHIVVVMEENQSYSTVVGNSSAWPNLNRLISNGALATRFYGDVHPSIGNYFMLTTGQVITTNDNSTTVENVDNLARRMLAAHIPFRIYAEGIARGYVGGNTGAYLIRHNPFALLSDIAGNAQVAQQVIWPFTQFAADVKDGTLPEFSFIVPDVNDDAHNGSPQQADSWLQTQVVDPLYNDSAFRAGGDGLLTVSFDESADSDTSYGGGHVATVLWGPNVKAGYTQTSGTIYQHQSTLRTIMQSLNLPNPPAAAGSAPSMFEFFR